jgi:hypothetical protein
VVKDESLKTALKQQNDINEALCAQNCIGRWIWKSGELLSQNIVPWDIQSINTCADNFLWDKGKNSVVTVAPGLYEICCGFYSKKLPLVQVFVNGEAILSIN